MTAEATESTQATRPEVDLRALQRMHLAAPSEAGASGGASRMVPAAFAGFLDLLAVRHDYPLVLWEGTTGELARPLARIVDELVAKTDEDRRRAVRTLLLRLEVEIKRLAEHSRYAQLSDLWARAAEALLGNIDDTEEREAAATELRTQRKALPADGVVIECRADAARKLFAHAWDRLQAEQADRETEALERLIGGVEDILAADRALSPQATSPEALGASLGEEHAGGIDFEKLASVLRTSKHHRPLSATRRRRLKQVLKVMSDELGLLARGAGNGAKRRSTRRLVTTCGTCEEALALFQAEIYRMVALVRAIRIARLEIDNRYREERHDAFFESFGPDHLTTEERRALPPVLVYLDGDAIKAADQAALLDILASDLPIKVLIEVTRVPAGALPAPGPASVAGWLERLAGMATTLEGAFVLQGAVSHLPVLASEISGGLRFEGPSLFTVFTGPREPRDDLPPYLLAAAAVESRAFPCFVSDPARGTRWADRFSIAHNPEPESAWPGHRIEYEDAAGAPVTQDAAFTMVDFLACDPRFAGHYVPIDRGSPHPDMIPASEYLLLGDDAAATKVPFVLLLDADSRLHRAVVRRGPLAAARRCHARWCSLQELAGIDNSWVERAIGAERAKFEAELEAEREALRASAPAAGEPAPAAAAESAPPAESAEAAPAAEPAAEERDPDSAWIETEMCTACNDCVDRNSQMFGYNDVKQAYINNLQAGTYRELVEAAENCPVCIIHPGKPWDQSEPGLEELVARAQAI